MADSPEHVWELLEHGMELSEGGDVAEALRVFDQAAAIHPEARAVKYLRATCLLDLGREAEAEAAVREALSGSGSTPPTSRQSAQMWLLLGLILHQKGEPRGAAMCLMKAFEFDVPPNTLAQSWTMLAHCQMHFDVHAAAESAERALEIDPAWDEAVNIRDDARHRLGDDRS